MECGSGMFHNIMHPILITEYHPKTKLILGLKA